MVAQTGLIYPNFQPRYYQYNAVAATFDYFSRQAGNPVIAMPTGSGKSWVIAMIIYSALTRWNNQRCIMATHDALLVKQNLEKLHTIWPCAPVGVYGASLGRSEAGSPITFAMVKSMASAMRKAESDGLPNPFGFVNFMLIDEAQYVGEKEGSEYEYVISELKKINPQISIIGLSATPFRMRMGYITENGVFTDFCYDITRAEDFVRLVREGFLAPLYTPAQVRTLVDARNVGLLGGEYNQSQAQALIDCDDVSFPAIKETIRYGENRGSWLIFASSIRHSENLVGMLQSLGISSAAIHSKNRNNDEILKDFDNQKIRCVVNNNKLTVGYDNPKIDLISILRLTNSSGLWGQILGRGVRPYEGKTDCLCLDFVGNTERLGPINDLTVPQPPGKSRSAALSGQIVKICKECGNRNSSRARQCLVCEADLPMTSENPISERASNNVLVSGLMPEEPVIENFKVVRVIYNKHKTIRRNSGNVNSPASMKVSYFTDGRSIDEYVCFEHTGYARRAAEKWWSDRHSTQCPMTTDDALRHISSLKKPSMISVRTDKQYPEIRGVKW